ncbi:MAG: hypothetical protein N3A54_04085 [Patescibacteria group bacterium]|nr:hypothetical protein [Patescibacteria group bacterium]
MKNDYYDWEIKKLAEIDFLYRELYRAKRSKNEALVKHYEFIIGMKRAYYIFKYYSDKILSFLLAIFGGK